MQQVVFNAHYMTFCDEAMAGWLAEAVGWNGGADQFDWMLVKTVLEWQSSATYQDRLDVDCGIARWGTTSFDVMFRGMVADRPVFTATITYVAIAPGTTTKMEVPDELRASLAVIRT